MTTYSPARGIAHLQRYAVPGSACANALAVLRLTQDAGDPVAADAAYELLDLALPHTVGGVLQYSRVDATIVSRATRA